MTINKLAETLTVQLRLLEELLALLERETRELAEVNIDAMTEINALKEDLAARIDGNTAPLRRVIAETASSLGLATDCYLGALAEKLGQQGNKEIPELHRQLNRVAEMVQQAAAMNREIAERFSATLGQTLNFLTQILNQSAVYGASGGYQQRTAGSVMINREA